jgi:hypothetical protein
VVLRRGLPRPLLLERHAHGCCGRLRGRLLILRLLRLLRLLLLLLLLLQEVPSEECSPRHGKPFNSINEGLYFGE